MWYGSAVMELRRSANPSDRNRRRRLLNAIGMSGKQMKKMLIWESATYIGGAIVLTVTMGNLLGWLICQAEIVKNQWAFIYHFTLVPVIVCLPLLILVAIAIPLTFYKSICKKSIVERLRVE
ncbi:MAG: FtsX-like permease family protein [Lachnospiraceae bacterium]